MNKFYLTTAIPYVNGRPHIGHALEYFQADTVRRYHDLLGEETLILSGSDENALKNVQAAEKEGVDVSEFLKTNSNVFKDAYENLGVHLDIFQRSSDEDKHWPGVQKLWKLCEDSGDIYKKSYEGLYCVGCESFKTEKELASGLCPDHQKPPIHIKEENYFFKLSKYQEDLISLIESDTLKIVPENKKHETLTFIKSGLEDFSISRSNERAQGVGVPVPGDDTQKIYVWFDALSIYMTGIGFGWDEDLRKKWWPADLHIIGKDINRFHTVYWPAMLLSAKLPLPKSVLIHSFILTNGQKMSKTLGNVIDPFELVEKCGLEPLRYYLLSQIPIDQDGDITLKRFEEIYNSDLANGLGNLVARVAKLCENNSIEAPPPPPLADGGPPTNLDKEVEEFLKSYRFSDALNLIWQQISEADKLLSETKPWELDAEKAKGVLDTLVEKIQHIGCNLKPLLPETSDKILSQFSGKIKPSESLFPRVK